MGTITTIPQAEFLPLATSFSFADIQQMAQVVAQSGLFPSLKNPAQVIALMLLCQSKGLHPAVVMERYHIIEGKPGLKADVMLAEFLAHGGRVEWHERTDTLVAATFTAPNAGAVEVAWTIEQARAAGLASKDNWRKYPRQMLSARVISEGVGLTMPGVRMGVYTPEEVQDFDDEPEPRPRAPRAQQTYQQIDEQVAANGGKGKVYRQFEPAKTVGETGEAITAPQLKALGAMQYPGSATGFPTRKTMTKAQASQLIDYYNRHKKWEGAPGDPGTTTEANDTEEILTDPFAEEGN